MNLLRTTILTLTAVTACCALAAISLRAADKDKGSSGNGAAPLGAMSDLCHTEGDIPGFVYARGISKPVPHFPAADQNDSSEGWALLEFTIAKDGSVRDIVVSDLIGATSIAESGVAALATWRYTPATRHGVPVDQYGNTLDITYRYPGSMPEERKPFHPYMVDAYNEGKRLVLTERYGDAITALKAAFAQRYNLFEHSMLSYVMALAYFGTHDEPNALVYIRHATIENAGYLDHKVTESALQMRMQAELQNGDLRNFACAFEDLKGVRRAATEAGTPAATMAAKVLATLDDPAPIVVAAQTPAAVGPDQLARWDHNLMRQKFLFSDVAPGIKNFHLVCRTTVLDSQIDADTQWTVPPEAGACKLHVYGAPGTTFKLVELR
jgi:TonB family protein